MCSTPTEEQTPERPPCGSLKGALPAQVWPYPSGLRIKATSSKGPPHDAGIVTISCTSIKCQGFCRHYLILTTIFAIHWFDFNGRGNPGRECAGHLPKVMCLGSGGGSNSSRILVPPGPALIISAFTFSLLPGVITFYSHLAQEHLGLEPP